MITFDRVSKRYEEGHDALREVSVSIDRDELVFLTGHSGAGKSTLLRLIMLMDRPTVARSRSMARIWRRCAPAAFPSIAATLVSSSRITNCCSIDRYSTMWPYL